MPRWWESTGCPPATKWMSSSAFPRAASSTSRVSESRGCPYPKTELEPSLELTAGEPYSAGHIKSDLKLIHDYYGSRGYADVIVSPRITRISPTQLNVVYAVSEGQRS